MFKRTRSVSCLNQQVEEREEGRGGEDYSQYAGGWNEGWREEGDGGRSLDYMIIAM